LFCCFGSLLAENISFDYSENNESHYSTPKSRAAQDDPDYDTLDVLNGKIIYRYIYFAYALPTS
jgi:hypothetical protein